mmetsp:Transcript_35232/g.99728  ORF Transcript_35232/g.99728 Transcript_35232/m.99728 type:complete len:108 (+) Transcript_35232:106-429(+)
MAETKKESFRKYLESAGVIDSLTKVLVALYEEPDKPTNAMSSIVQLLGGPSPDEYNALLAERDELLERVRRAEEELAQIKASSYSPVPMYSEQAPISTPACIFEVKP